MEPLIDDLVTTDARTRELERRVLEAAQALLAHHGTTFAFVPIPGRLPVRCVAIGELTRIREMVRSNSSYV
jgi:hypothetical protein